MSDLKVCRICLRTESKMYNFSLYQLKLYYEEVMALKINEQDDLPQYFCYECATILHKFHKFKEKCYIGQKILKEMLWKGPITTEAIYKIDRKDAKLNSPLSILAITNLVETYSMKDKQVINHKKELLKIEKVELDCYSETSLTDREDVDLNDGDDYDINTDNDKKNTSNNKKVNMDEDMNCNDANNIEKPNNDDDKRKIDGQNNDAMNNSETENDCDESNNEHKRHKSKYTYTGKSSVLNNEANWKITLLSEEEALKDFRAKAEEKKYVAAAYKCDKCYKGFSKKDMIDRHIQLRHIECLGNHECRFCGYRFKLECYLKKHMKQHYTRYNCQRCDLLCSLENTALLHEEYHNGVTRKCIYCDEVFRHSSTYYTHLRTHRSEHVCTLCGASFVSKLGLQQHKHIKHVIIEIESPDDDEEVNTYCKRCDIRFETRKAYEEHLFHSALHSDEEGKSKSIEKVNDASDAPDKKSTSKKVLGKKEQAKITKDLRKRNGEDHFDFKRSVNKRYKKKERRMRTKPTTCHQCGEHFDTQAACMKHHIEAHPRTSFHPPNQRYICEICGSSLAPGSIATHQNMHTREKMHTCDTCGRQFHAIIGLKRHMVTHTGEKPYACPLCDKRFTQSNSMKLHYRTFHLKQPYPKRNRRAKKDEPKETVEAEESNTEESSDESLPDVEPQDQTVVEPVVNVLPDRTDDTMHYLTLT